MCIGNVSHLTDIYLQEAWYVYELDLQKSEHAKEAKRKGVIYWQQTKSIHHNYFDHNHNWHSWFIMYGGKRAIICSCERRLQIHLMQARIKLTVWEGVNQSSDQAKGMY